MFKLEKLRLTSPQNAEIVLLYCSDKKVIKQAVGGAGQKSKILAIPNQYKNTLDNLVNSSDLEHPEMLRPNSQRQRNPMPNLGDDDNPPVRQEEYKKDGG